MAWWIVAQFEAPVLRFSTKVLFVGINLSGDAGDPLTCFIFITKGPHICPALQASRPSLTSN